MKGCGNNYSDDELEQFFVCGVYSEVMEQIMLCKECSPSLIKTQEKKNG